jgi:hypothetical protein
MKINRLKKISTAKRGGVARCALAPPWAPREALLPDQIGLLPGIRPKGRLATMARFFLLRAPFEVNRKSSKHGRCAPWPSF